MMVVKHPQMLSQGLCHYRYEVFGCSHCTLTLLGGLASLRQRQSWLAVPGMQAVDYWQGRPGHALGR